MNAREDAEWVGDTITQLKAEIERLRERCLAYKCQVKAGSIAIQHLQGEIARLRRDCAELYQVIGVLSVEHGELFDDPQVAKALDNASAAANGDPRPHDNLLPFTLPSG